MAAGRLRYYRDCDATPGWACGFGPTAYYLGSSDPIHLPLAEQAPGFQLPGPTYMGIGSCLALPPHAAVWMPKPPPPLTRYAHLRPRGRYPVLPIPMSPEPTPHSGSYTGLRLALRGPTHGSRRAHRSRATVCRTLLAVLPRPWRAPLARGRCVLRTPILHHHIAIRNRLRCLFWRSWGTLPHGRFAALARAKRCPGGLAHRRAVLPRAAWSAVWGGVWLWAITHS